MTINVAILAFEGCTGSSVHGPADLFSIANTIAQQAGHQTKRFKTSILSPGALAGPQQVTTTNGHVILADGNISETTNADIIIVPGIGVNSINDLERRLEDLQPVIDQLKNTTNNKSVITASCTGTFLLAKTGLLDGKRATTTWWLEELFRAKFGKVNLTADQILVDEGQVITSAAGTSYLDLCLHLIGRFAGANMARLCAKYLVIDGGRMSQRAYAAPTHFMRRDKLIERADGWVRAHISEKIRVDALADHLGVGSRTLIRRMHQHLGITPQVFIKQIMMEQAKTLLETTPDTIPSIGCKVGYSDENAFRRSFTAYAGLTPAQYRRRFKTGAHAT